ncbi:hypothetical protein [Bdellovibrio sp. NC01]|uniref:hypothetical protein n=1 Tax=Bdellovibrio sp. NC01 TaxID=2220073 RepID=UPI0011587CDA|nr:hypothetical protein [Bdellovibrio sp. NC01]QDK38868.1 hypothetical protein DOE51_15385 [Bdellovibrio sp. NC01]
MRKLIIIAMLFASSHSFAFSNPAVLKATQDLTVYLQKTQSSALKARTLAAFKNFVSSQIDQMDMPEDGLTASNQQAKEFASLLEFETYLENLNVRNLNEERCKQINAHLEATSHGASGQPILNEMTAYQASEQIVSALCPKS